MRVHADRQHGADRAVTAVAQALDGLRQSLPGDVECLPAQPAQRPDERAGDERNDRDHHDQQQQDEPAGDHRRPVGPLHQATRAQDDGGGQLLLHGAQRVDLAGADLEPGGHVPVGPQADAQLLALGRLSHGAQPEQVGLVDVAADDGVAVELKLVEVRQRGEQRLLALLTRLGVGERVELAAVEALLVQRAGQDAALLGRLFLGPGDGGHRAGAVGDLVVHRHLADLVVELQQGRDDLGVFPDHRQRLDLAVDGGFPQGRDLLQAAQHRPHGLAMSVAERDRPLLGLIDEAVHPAVGRAELGLAVVRPALGDVESGLVAFEGEVVRDGAELLAQLGDLSEGLVRVGVAEGGDDVQPAQAHGDGGRYDDQRDQARPHVPVAQSEPL